MDGAGDRPTKMDQPNISHKLCPGAPAGLKTGARFRRAPVLKPAGAPGLEFQLIVG